MHRTVCVALALLAVGCSSTGVVRAVPGATDSGSPHSCFESSAPNQGCINCVESTCASQLSAVESGCNDLIQCECPGGYYSPSAAGSCASEAQESSCPGPAQTLAQCETQSCSGECTVQGGSGSGG